MLHPIITYYELSRKSGIRSMNCAINCCIAIPGEKCKRWPEVKNYYDYINKCYELASKVPFEELQMRSENAISKEELVKVKEDVRREIEDLGEKNLNHMMGYTPITHMQEQLFELYEKIQRREASPFVSMVLIPTTSKNMPTIKKGFLARLFG